MQGFEVRDSRSVAAPAAYRANPSPCSRFEPLGNSFQAVQAPRSGLQHLQDLLFLTPEEAAAHVEHGQTVGFSGFTPAGAPKAIPTAIADRAEAAHQRGEPFKIGVIIGASTGPSLDGALAKADAVSFRTPYQSDANLRARINAGDTRFFDMHLSMMPQAVRYGFLGPIDWAVIEACDVTAGGGLVLTTAVGAAPTFGRQAKRVLID